jgi:predicted HD phosphohydrolase
MLVRDLEGLSKTDFDTLHREVTGAQINTPARIRSLLGLLRNEHGGFAVDQLTHCLQTATRAFRDGADDEVIVFALCHDMGKSVSWINHAAIVAEMVRPFLSERIYWLARTHQDFQGRFYYHHSGQDPSTYLKYKDHEHFDLALRFSAWDTASFDPDYDTLPLSHFDPLIDKFFSSDQGVLKPPSDN